MKQGVNDVSPYNASNVIPMQPQLVDARYTVGFVYKRELREFLREAKWSGLVRDFYERKDFLSSTFAIKGMTKATEETIDRWLKV